MGQEGVRGSVEGKWCSPSPCLLIAVVIDEIAISETGEEQTAGSGLVRAGVRVVNCLPGIADPDVLSRRNVLRRREAEAGGGGGTETET